MSTTPPPEPAPDTRLDDASELLQQGIRATEAMRIGEASSKLFRALELLEDDTERPLPEPTERRLRMVAQARDALAIGLLSKEDNGLAADELARSIAAWRELTALSDDPESAPTRLPLAVSLMNYGSALAEERVPDEAIAALEECVELLDVLGDEQLAMLRVAAGQNLGTLLSQQERHEEAVRAFGVTVQVTRERLQAGATEGDEEGVLVAEVTPELLSGYAHLLVGASVALHRAGDDAQAATAAEEGAQMAQAVAEELGDPRATEIYVVAQLNLVSFYESTGRFAQAEDALFKAMETAGPREDIVGRGRVFYQELLDRSDEELEAGDLPRDEVEESLEELERTAAEAE